jgi:hypothetical protein
VIKARSGSVAILGLEAGNIDRLKEGKPMLVKLKELGLPDISVVILYGDTHTDIMGKIERELGLKVPVINPINEKPV